MSKWAVTRVSEMADIISGGTPKTEIAEYWNGDIPWLSVKDFSGDSKRVYSSEKSIPCSFSPSPYGPGIPSVTEYRKGSCLANCRCSRDEDADGGSSRFGGNGAH